jgi:hypothetical protein
MASAAEVQIGINAAMPVALADVDQFVPSEFRSMVPMADVQKIVSDIVMVSAAAIDASRAVPPASPPLTSTIKRLSK